jgi:hypothetical protein
VSDQGIECPAGDRRAQVGWGFFAQPFEVPVGIVGGDRGNAADI